MPLLPPTGTPPRHHLSLRDLRPGRPVQLRDDAERLLLEAINWIAMERCDIAGTRLSMLRDRVPLRRRELARSARRLESLGALSSDNALVRRRYRLTVSGLATLLAAADARDIGLLFLD